MINQGIKLKLKLNSKQIDYINKHFGCSRFIYNYFLKENIDRHNTKNPKLSLSDMVTSLPILKKEYHWLKVVDSTMLQKTCKNLDTAYKNFFNKISDLPKFKKKYNSYQSFNIINANKSNIRVNIDNTVRVGKLGNLKLVRPKKQLKYLNNLSNYRILSATISRDTDYHYYVSFNIECEPKTFLPANQDKIALDLGIKNNYTAYYEQDTNYNYWYIDNPKSFNKYQNKLAKFQRRLARKEKKSNNYIKCKEKVAKIHFKIKSIRKDFNHQLTSKLIKTFQMITIEDLDLESMKQNNMGKQISDLAFHQFKVFLEYKAKWYGRILNKVNKYFASSKLCNNCLNINSNLTLNDRTWTCQNCNTIHDRDINAAMNLFSAGLIRWNFGITNIDTKTFIECFN